MLVSPHVLLDQVSKSQLIHNFWTSLFRSRPSGVVTLYLVESQASASSLAVNLLSKITSVVAPRPSPDVVLCKVVDDLPCTSGEAVTVAVAVTLW